MTISSQIIEVLNDLCMKFGMAIDWSQENVMPYLQELAGKYISWEVATSTAWLILLAVLAIVGIVLIVIDCKNTAKYEFGIMIFIGCILIGIAILAGVFEVGDILTCKFFPEKQIIEYVHYLIQTKG